MVSGEGRRSTGPEGSDDEWAAVGGAQEVPKGPGGVMTYHAIAESAGRLLQREQDLRDELHQDDSRRAQELDALYVAFRAASCERSIDSGLM